jgi:hypothetical protein
MRVVLVEEALIVIPTSSAHAMRRQGFQP